MINLLPSTEKEKIILEKKRKLIIILWILILFSIFCFALVLLSIKFYIYDQLKSQRVIFAEAEREFESSGAQDLQEKINSVNINLTKLDEFYQNKIYLIEILEEISNILPQRAYLTGFSTSIFRSEEESGFKITLSGFALNREILFDFKENLEKSSNFKEIYFPPANWVEPTDIDFIVSFEASPAR